MNESAKPTSRLESVDVLRGLVMVLMALDHTRDFFHAGAFRDQNPLDLTQTTPALFFTRWITHFCAPVFVFLAGTGAFLSTTRGRTTRELSWFLLTRGLWLVVLELTWVRWAGWTFDVNLHEHLGLVIWAIGWSMVVLAGLVWLPIWAVTGFGIVMVAGHNALDGIQPVAGGRGEGVWRILHAGGPFELWPNVKFVAGYPLVPWIGVMAAGFGFGRVFTLETVTRRRVLAGLGAVLLMAFLVVRGLNGYGNPKPWQPQDQAWKTMGAFVDCQKYPPSLDYLLMTLGPALLVLALLDRGTPGCMRPALLFGRVPLFYYLVHLPLIHGLAVLAHLAWRGHAEWLYGVAKDKPPDAGFGLLVVYAIWVLVVVLLYPACLWFAALKRRSRAAWLSYL